MAYAIGALLGAFVITLLLSRLFSKWPFGHATGVMKALGPNLLTLAVATLLGGFGFSRGGGPRFLQAAAIYFVPVAVWSIMDLILWRRRTKKQTP